VSDDSLKYKTFAQVFLKSSPDISTSIAVEYFEAANPFVIVSGDTDSLQVVEGYQFKSFLFSTPKLVIQEKLAAEITLKLDCHSVDELYQSEVHGAFEIPLKIVPKNDLTIYSKRATNSF